jgi:hypothetical protein
MRIEFEFEGEAKKGEVKSWRHSDTARSSPDNSLKICEIRGIGGFNSGT